MRQAKKGKTWHFGMKVHVGSDRRGVVHSLVTTHAAAADIKQMEALLHGEEREVFGDQAYWKEADRQRFRAKGVHYRVNRRGTHHHPLTEQQKKINLKISTDQRAGDRVLAVRELSKSNDQKRLWESLKFEVKRGERIGIIGPNGSGKSTLLKVLLAQEDADDGEVRWGANLNIGYYEQRLDLFDPDNTVYEEISGGREEKGLQALRDVLIAGGCDPKYLEFNGFHEIHPVAINATADLLRNLLP